MSRDPRHVRYPNAEAALAAARNDLRRDGTEPLLGVARGKAEAALTHLSRDLSSENSEKVKRTRAR